MKNVYRSIGLIGLASLIGSCGGDGPVAPPPPTTASVTMSATTGTLVPGANFQLSATPRDQSGNALSRTLAWSSSDAAKATVSSSGMVSGVAPGSVTITAAVDGKSATSAVTVLDGGVVTTGGGTLTLLSGAVQVDVPSGAVPSPTNISVVPSTAYATDPRVVKETPFDFGPSGTQFAKPVSIKIKYAAANLPPGTEEAALQLYLSTTTGWQAVEGSLVDLTAKTVAADVSHFSVYAILTPLPVSAVTIHSPPNKPPLVVGDTAQLTATLTDSQGGTPTNRAVAWATSNAAIASVTASGLVTGVAPGTATVSATAGGVTSSLAITVTPVPIAGVAVTLLPQAVEVGQTSQASSVITDASGNILTGRAVSWSSDNSAIAAVSASGQVTAIAPGTAQITATSEGKTGSGVITVSAVPVSSITVTPASASVTAGATQQLAADTKDAHGNVLTGRAVTWSSNNNAVAAVSQTGVVTAVSVGTVTITATSEGKNGSASITVTPIPVAGLSLSAPTTPVVLGQTQQLTAIPKDGSGNTLAGRTVNWVSSNTAVLTVSAASTVSNSTGATVIVTATGLGTAIITASSESAPSAATPVITVNPVPVATVTVSPASATLVLGLTPTQQLTAALKDVDNTVLTGRTVTWSSSNPAAATVDANGFVTAIGVGISTITATSEGKSGTSSITVSLAPVASVSVSLAQSSITAVGTSQASATTLDSNGNVLTGRVLTWSSSNAAVATVDAQGLVTALAVGTSNIIATSEGKTGSSTITVTQAPVATITVSLASSSINPAQTTQATATLLDAKGGVLTGRTIAWSSSNNGVASVGPATGLVTGVGAGTANIIATSEGIAGNASLIVTAAPVATVAVNPPTANLVLGITPTQQLTAVLSDANGHTLGGRLVTWISSNASAATVDGNGLVTAVAAGTSTITATSEGKSGTSTITVSLAPVASVTVGLAPLSITTVGTSQATAATLDANGGTLTGRVVTWSSDNIAIATVSAQGVVSGVAVGTANIIATSEGKTGSATVTVTPAPVASVSVAPGSASVVAGSTTQLSAETRDAKGGMLTGRLIAWSTDAPAVATVSATGLVTAIATGSANITAESEGKIGNALITVTPVPVASVSVSLASGSVIAGQTTQATAGTLDAGGNTLTGRAIVWSSDNVSVATVSSSGLVTSIAPGSANIVATSEAKSGHAILTVTPVPVATVTVTPGTASVAVGSTQQLTATTKDGNGVTLTGRVLAWSSSDATIASVDVNGLVTAHAIGPATITATSEGKSGSSSITVTPVPVASVTVTLTPNSITAVGTSQAAAVTRDANGGVLSGRAITWSSSNVLVATVSAQGVVSAIAEGTANIIATSEGQTGSALLTVTQAPVATVTVNPPSATVFQGANEQLAAVLEDAHHNVLTRPVTWSSNNTPVATVSTTGLVTAAPSTMGVATISATSEGQTGTSLITVSQVPVASVSVALTPSTINVGQTSQAAATLLDAGNQVLTGRVITWTSDDIGVATVSSSGVVTALAAGTAHISGASGGQTGSATLTVTPIPVASVSVSLGASPLQVGQTTQATATTRDANNNVLSGRVIAWSSDNTTVATVSVGGLVTAVSAGTANIVATSEGTNGSATLTVVPVPVASLTLSAPITPVVLGQTQQLTAVPKDGSGNILTGRTVNWASSNPAILSVSSPSSVSSSSGATIGITAAGVGTAIITASSESAPTASTPVITVNPIPVATVTVSPPSATLALGVNSTQQLTATLKDANSNVLTGRLVTWTSSNPSAATVDASGLVTAIGGGSTTITATSEGQAGTASITVTVPVWTVTVDPSSATLTVGLTHQLTATTKDVNGNVLIGRGVTWSSSDPTHATVSSTGLVTAVASGTAVITATSEGKSGTSSITVTPIPVASVSVSLPGSTIQVGQTTQATATTFDSNNAVLTGRVVTWSTGNAAVATVSSTGLVTAIGVGSTAIIATSEGKTGNATITVVAVPVASVTVSPVTASIIAGATQQLSAETRDANNVLLTGRLVTWSSNNTAVATVNSSGLVTAISVGGATITAASEGKSGTSSITVLPVPVASVNVSLSPNSITAVGTSQATATTLDSQGGLLTGRVVTWTSANPAIATVNGQGVVTAVAVGTVGIIATSEGQSGSATLTVMQAPVASVTVSPSTATVVQGTTEQLSVTLKDAHGNVLTRPVTWTSSSDAIASVSQTGLVTANAVGTATITATSEGQTGTASVTVSAVPVASVTVTLSSGTITDAQTAQATAIARDAGGNVLVGRTITWTSDNAAVATVSPTGFITPVAAGSAQIRASTGGQTGSAALTVIPRVAAVIVTPSSANIVIGSTRQLAAETRDANNNVLTGRSITWSSDAPSIASVSTDGLVTSLALGSATITATSEGVTGTSAISVVPVPVSLVTVSLGSTTITVGQTTQATATTRDANGNILTGRSITWSSGNSSLATVSSAGLVTAIGAGSVQIIAMSEGKTGSATLTIDPAPVATVTLSAPATPVVVGATQVLTAQPKDGGGNVLTGRTVNWTSSNTAVLTVSAASSVSSASGATITLTAVGAGTATVTATSESAPSATTPPITVNPVPVATVNVALSPTSITAVGTSQGTATTLDANGNTLTGRAVVWSSSNNAVATVDVQGVVTAVAVGTASISATSEGHTGSATITVTPAPVATITVALASSSISAVQTTQATATLLDSKGRVLTGRIVAWSSDNTAAATVGASGLVAGVSVGTANIIASSEGKSGAALLTVTSAPVATVTISAPTTPMIVGGTQQLTATTKDANGNVLAGRTVTWVSSNTSVLTVSSSGNPATVTAVGVGTATITATSETVSSSPTPTITSNPIPVATVTVSLGATSISALATTQATAVTKDANGNTLTGRAVTWSSSNVAVATVSASGLVTAVAVGSANIIATSEGKTGSATLTVTPIPVASVTVSLNATTITAVGTTQATATTLDANGNTLTGRAVAWASSNIGIATVDAQGVVTAIAVGTSSITATSEGKSGSATITVTPAPVATVAVSLASSSINAVQTTQATATLRDAQGRLLAGRTVTWSADNASVSTVDQSTGLVTAVSPGAANITATSEGITGSAPLTVTPAPVATVAVNPATANLVLGITPTQQLSAVLSDANGHTLSGRVVAWTSSNGSAATVDANGLVTAVGAGSSTITATSEGKSGTSSITVSLAPVASVTVSAPTTPMMLGAAQQLTATTKDANSNVLTGRTVTWVSSNTGVLTVSSSGNPATVTAVGLGTATITATSESVSSSPTPTITVNPIPVASVTVGLDPASITAVGTSQATATTLDANGGTLTGRVIAWSSSNSAVATVSAQGVVAGIAAGTSSITATSEGKSGSSPITVTPAPVDTVTVSLAASSINAVQTTQATAILHDAQGRELTGRTVDWSSDNISVATVSSTTGLVTAVSPGTANIIAASEGKRDSAAVTVTAAPVDTVTVTPATVSLVLGITPTQQMTVVTKDAKGSVLTGRAVAWVSSNPAAATVNETGLVTAVGAGSTTITATSEAKTGTSSVTVSLAPVASVAVSSPTTPMVIGATQQLTAETKDAAEHVLTGRVITWASSNTAVLTVSASGSPATVTAVSEGTATITATSETVSSNPTQTITVIPPPVAFVTLSFATTAMVVGGTQTLTAQPRDGTNHILSGRTVNWVSSDPTVLAVSAASSVSSSTGATVTLTAVATGNATVTATSETAPSATTPVIQVRPALASGPLRVSTVNPRYFADPTGRVVYLTGSEYWKTIQDNGPSNPPPTFDYSGFLDSLQRHNHNFTRLYMWEQARWSAETSLSHWFSPTPYMRTGPGTAADGGPMFDVSQINPDYLARVRQRVIEAGARGIYVSVMLFNGWSVEDKEGTGGGNPWLAHPFNAANNINGINGDPNNDASGAETQTLAIPEVTALQDTYVKAVIDAVNDLDNVIYEISNESDQSSDAWQYHMIDLIRNYEATKPKQHAIGMSVPYPTVPQGTNSDVLNSSADWVSMNGNADAPAIADGAKVSLWDTDHLCGICGDSAWAWKSFTRGHNPLLMDGYDGSAGVGDPEYNPSDPKWEQIRTNMGYARSLALRMDLAHDTPRGDLVSTGYALAGTDYLVFLPTGGTVNVNLSFMTGTRTVEWFNPSTGQTTAGGTVTGGSPVNFTAPFNGMAVLFIHP